MKRRQFLAGVLAAPFAAKLMSKVEDKPQLKENIEPVIFSMNCPGASNISFAEFQERILKQISCGLEVPYEIMAHHYSLQRYL